jgi:hypothetical protein
LMTGARSFIQARRDALKMRKEQVPPMGITYSVVRSNYRTPIL